jgi:hypothetical protein
VLRAARAVVSLASVMVQVEDEATEPVKEACRGEEKEGDLPPPSCPSAAQPRTPFLIRLATGVEGTGEELGSKDSGTELLEQLRHWRLRQ